MGEMSKLRHTAIEQIAEVLTKMPRCEFTEPLGKSKKYLGGAKVHPMKAVQIMSTGLESASKTLEALTDEKWGELVALKEQELEAVIESHHAVLDALNEELAKLQEGAIKSFSEVKTTLANLVITMAEAKILAETRAAAAGLMGEMTVTNLAPPSIDAVTVGDLQAGDGLITISHVSQPMTTAQLAPSVTDSMNKMAEKLAMLEAQMALKEGAVEIKDWQIKSQMQAFELMLKAQGIDPGGQDVKDLMQKLEGTLDTQTKAVSHLQKMNEAIDAATGPIDWTELAAQPMKAGQHSVLDEVAAEGFFDIPGDDEDEA